MSGGSTCARRTDNFTPIAGLLGFPCSGGGCVTNKVFHRDNLEVLRQDIAGETVASVKRSKCENMAQQGNCCE